MYRYKIIEVYYYSVTTLSNVANTLGNILVQSVDGSLAFHIFRVNSNINQIQAQVHQSRVMAHSHCTGPGPGQGPGPGWVQ